MCLCVCGAQLYEKTYLQEIFSVFSACPFFLSGDMAVGDVLKSI